MLREIEKDLWTVERPFRVPGLGLELGLRMTVIRLSGGGLFVHSPVALDDGLRQALAQVGPVRFIVAPSSLHHLFLADFLPAYPDARLFGPARLLGRREDLHFHGTLSDTGQTEWSDEIDQLLIRGAPRAEEHVFLHKASRTLIATDLVFNIHRTTSRWTRLYLQLNRAYGRLAVTWPMRLMLRDRGLARGSLDRVLSWDFDRVIVSHGDVLERGGRDALRNAVAWI